MTYTYIAVFQLFHQNFSLVLMLKQWNRLWTFHDISEWLTCTLHCSVNFTRNLLAVSPTEIVKQIMNNSQYIRVTYMYTIVLHWFHQKAFHLFLHWNSEIDYKHFMISQNDLHIHGSAPIISPEDFTDTRQCSIDFTRTLFAVSPTEIVK